MNPLNEQLLDTVKRDSHGNYLDALSEAATEFFDRVKCRVLPTGEVKYKLGKSERFWGDSQKKAFIKWMGVQYPQWRDE